MANPLQKGKNAMTTQFDGLTATFLASIATCLPRDISGDVMQGWNQNPKALQKVLREALCPPTVVREQSVVRDWKVWMEAEIGGVPKGQLASTLESEGFFVSDWAKNVMKQETFTVLPGKKLLKLARCPVHALGFTEKPTTTQLQHRILEVGELCPAELGPHVRRQLKNQPKGDIFWLVMEQIVDSDGLADVFRVRRGADGEQWLSADCAFPVDQWDLDREVVFVLASDSPLEFDAKT